MINNINKSSVALSLFLCFIIIFASCASKPSNIMPTNTSPQMYANWDCDQIQNEIFRLNNAVSNLTAQQQKIYNKDQLFGWGGTLLLWPLYFFIKGDGAVASQLGEAKGQLNALNQVSIRKRCGF